jgi:hypothetical protein
VIDLGDVREFSFHSGKREVVTEGDARFVLIVGSDEFIDMHEDDLLTLPTRTALYQNYPNPFGTSTIIRYDLACEDAVSLKIYDATGALIKIVYDGRRSPGRHEAVWFGDTEGGGRAAVGIYFCRLKTGAGSDQTRKLLLIK